MTYERQLRPAIAKDWAGPIQGTFHKTQICNLKPPITPMHIHICFSAHIYLYTISLAEGHRHLCCHRKPILIQPTCSLPFRFFRGQKHLQDPHLRLQALQPRPHLPPDLLLIIAQLHIKVFSIRRRGHGGGEDRFDHEAVVWF